MRSIVSGAAVLIEGSATEPSMKAPRVSGTITEKMILALRVLLTDINYQAREEVSRSRASRMMVGTTYISQSELQDEEGKDVSDEVDKAKVAGVLGVVDLEKASQAFAEVDFHEL